MEFRNQNAVAYLHTSEDLSEVPDGEVKLMFVACTHLGGWETWPDYVSLVTRVVYEAKPKLRPDARIVVMQTDAFIDGNVMPRGPLLLSQLTGPLRLVDYKIWKRLNANLRQPPWSHVYVMAPFSASGSRPHASNIPYFQGVWDYPQTSAGKLNAWPDPLCRMLVETFTEPGDLILDPFAGSCRILAVASQLDRHAIGYEIDESLITAIQTNLNARPFQRDLTGNII